MATRNFHITYGLSEGGWLASIYTVPGCHAEGKTKEEARENVKRGLTYFFDPNELNEISFTEDPEPP